jgi:putative ABC transport system permease protein
MHRVALAMLFGNRAAVLGMLLGVGFASLLIALQGSIFTGVMHRTVALLKDTRAVPIWVMDPTVQYIDDVKPLDDAEVQRVRGAPGVAWAVPMTKAILRARLADGSYQACIVVGLDDASLAGGPPDLPPDVLERLRQPDAVIVDAVGARKKLLLPDGSGGTRPIAIGDTLELNDRRAVVVGTCAVSRGFAGQPTIYTTVERARRFAPAERRQLSFILAAPAPDISAETAAAAIADTTGLAALTHHQFVWKTVRYYIKNTPIPVNIGIGVVLALIVGTAITGLTFAGFVQNNLRYLGALKAMGATNALLLRLTCLQAAVVGIIGYGLGTGAAALIGHLLRGTELAFVMSWQLLAMTGVAVAVIILATAALSLRTVFRLEPAVVFR